jgi:hypothetical protein
MKKVLMTIFSSVVCITFSYGGGLLTNTNQSAHFLRNPARDASIEIDAAYTNPAGLAKLTNDGFHFSFTNQSAFQTRTITSTFKPFAGFGGDATKVFKGEASAPIIPSLQGAYKKGKWVLSGNLAVSGGGGKVTFNKGLPSFESPISMIPLQLETKGIPTSEYSVDAYMEGSSFIYGGQLGGTYAINEMFSVHAGFRMNIVNNKYVGYLRNISVNPIHPVLNPTGEMMLASNFFDNAAMSAKSASSMLQPIVNAGAGEYTLNQLLAGGQMTEIQINQLASGLGISAENAGSLTVNKVQDAYNQAAVTYEESADQTANKELDCSQSGWGITPILGVNFNWKNLNIGVKYEFVTSLNVENKTKRDDTGQFPDGVNTPHDIPALFTIGAQYKIIPSVTVSCGYHHFFDCDADMANNKEQFINGGINEYLLGAEWRICKMFLISAGGQITKTGVTDNYQTDLSYSLDSYSIGLGGAVIISEKVRINLGYLWTSYDDWTKNSDNYNGTSLAGTDVYARTNKAFAVGVDFRF